MDMRTFIKAFIATAVIVAAVIYATDSLSLFTRANNDAIPSEKLATEDAEEALKPAVILKANPARVRKGQSTNVIWSTADATSCIGGSNGQTPPGWDEPSLKGSLSFVPEKNLTLTLICSGRGGVTIEKADVSIGDPLPAKAVAPTARIPAPAVVTSPRQPLSASCLMQPVSFPFRYQTITRTALAEGGAGSYAYVWSGTDNLSGSNQSISVSYPTAGLKQSSVTVFSAGAMVSATCPELNIIEYPSRQIDSGSSGGSYNPPSNDPPPSNPEPPTSVPPTVELTATPSTVNEGEPVTVSWTTQRINVCYSSAPNMNLPLAWRNPGRSGSFEFVPTGSVTLRLVCYGGGASNHVSQSVDITVNAAPTGPVPAPLDLIAQSNGSSIDIYWSNSAELRARGNAQVLMEQSTLDSDTGTWSAWQASNMDGCDPDSCTMYVGIAAGTTYRFRARTYDGALDAYSEYSNETGEISI